MAGRNKRVCGQEKQDRRSETFGSKQRRPIDHTTAEAASARFDCSKVLLDHSIISGTNCGRYSKGS